MLGVARFGSTLSVLGALTLGSSLSLRGVSRVGSALSVLGSFHIGSSLSLRKLSRLGSSFSVFGQARFGASLSVFDCTSLGSSLSIRSFARFGSTISVQENARLCGLSATGFASFAASTSVNGLVQIGQATTYIATNYALQYDDVGGFLWDTINFYTAQFGGSTAYRSISMFGKGGTLHGHWVSDNTISSSDRRLKKSIKPLYEAMQRPGESQDASDGVGWVLRQLRPVSFKFKKGPEAKYSRYGFIAQELQDVIPSVVRPITSDGKPRLAVVYQDLIALLTSAAQMLQEKVSKQEDKIARLEEQLAAMSKKLDLLVEAHTDKASQKEPALVL